MHELTSEASELRIELIDFEGRAGYAKYSSFHVDNKINGYRLHVDGYEGTIGIFLFLLLFVSLNPIYLQ